MRMMNFNFLKNHIGLFVPMEIHAITGNFANAVPASTLSSLSEAIAHTNFETPTRGIAERNDELTLDGDTAVGLKNRPC